jgi:hypothetical protein
MGVHSTILIRTSGMHAAELRFPQTVEHLAHLRFVSLLLPPSITFPFVAMPNLGSAAEALPIAFRFSLGFGLVIVILAVTKAWYTQWC